MHRVPQAFLNNYVIFPAGDGVLTFFLEEMNIEWKYFNAGKDHLNYNVLN